MVKKKISKIKFFNDVNYPLISRDLIIGEFVTLYLSYRRTQEKELEVIAANN